MAATAVTESGGVRIITEVIPATDPRAAQLALGSGSPAPARTSFRVRVFRRAHPKVLGTIHIFSGIIHISFGIILTASEHGDPSLPVASGIFFWLGVLLLVSGSLLVESEKRDNIVLVQACCVVNVVVALGALVAVALHGTALAQPLPPCQPHSPFPLLPEWCFHVDSKLLRNGLDSILVLLCLLEFCTAVASLPFGYEAIRQRGYSHVVRGRGSWECWESWEC
ncbi:M4A15 protein, partial [Scytalopus superciliaris]|nr:M4A15 protein [Scytalopus superciliaris]